MKRLSIDPYIKSAHSIYRHQVIGIMDGFPTKTFQALVTQIQRWLMGGKGGRTPLEKLRVKEERPGPF